MTLKDAVRKIIVDFAYGFAVALGAGLGWTASMYLVTKL